MPNKKHHRLLLARREFLQAMGGLGSTLLLRSTFSGLAGLLSEGLARADSGNSKKYIFILLLGGPPRWMFDLPLFEGSGSTFNTQLPMVVTRRIPSGTAFKYEYAVAANAWHNVRLPLIWQEPCFKQLQKNMQIIRGITNRVDGHPFGQRILIHPDSGLPSISGLVADESDNLLGNINIGRVLPSTYRSSKRKYGALVVGKDVKSQLAGPFSSRGSSNLSQLETILTDLQEHGVPKEVLSAFEAAKKEYSAPKTILDFETIKNSYLAAVEAARASFNGNSGLYGFELQSELKLDETLNSFQGTAEKFATNFAALEFSFKSGKSNSLTASFENGLVNNDAHRVNQGDTLIGFTAYYLILAACLNQLIKNIGTDEFKNTVIQIAGDFNRLPKMGTDGSDHGWEGNVTSLFGGELKPRVIGAVQQDPARGNGHWGLAKDAYTPHAVADYVAQLLGFNEEQRLRITGGVAFTRIHREVA